ncbi:MAG: two-component system phosphate regulon sensor histidine kinase PhoR [Gammaproteobacteria bacterium]|jgi:two-component system phosphate regulon sensor histidine kinase PhoR
MLQASDFRRLFVVVFSATVVGWMIDDISLALLVALSLYTLWLHRNISQLLSWIRDRKNQHAPDPPGVFEDLCREIDYSRERHRKRKKKLGSYLRQFRLATRALPDGTIVLDDRGTVTWANKAATAYLGIRWPDDAGQRITNLIRLPEIAEFVDENKQLSSVDITSPIDPDLHLNIRITPYGNAQRLFVARDVTQLHRANRIRRDFVANVSHELRTPITVLRGYLENMSSQREQCPPSWHNAMAQMLEHVARMQSIVEDLLALSKLEQHDEVDHTEVVSVASLVADIHRESQLLNEKYEHIFALEVDTTLEIVGSTKELHSCFSNLVYNALHYSGKSKVIEIRWYQDADGAHFAVKDNGVGIAPQHLERLTERFYRVDTARDRTQGGTGLGLAIVKHVLTRHGGSLHIESELEKGSTFRCDFPPKSIVALEATEEIDQSA